MSYQRRSEVPKSYDTWYEDQIQRLLERTRTEHIVQAVYCPSCHGISKNPHGREKGPESCKDCGARFSAETPSILPDFVIKLKHHAGGYYKFGIIFVHGGIHFKDNKHMQHDYRQYTELLAHGYKVFVIKNETIKEAIVSFLNGWLGGVKQAMLDDAAYISLYQHEKELGLLQKAVLEHYSQKE